jgi:hypothetical protein
MRRRHPLATALASVFGIGLLGLSGLALGSSSSSASAKKPFDYDTSGVVGIGADPSSVTGPAVLQFQGLTNSVFNPAVTQPISLGQFVLSPTSSTGGQTTTYNDTPFQIEVQAPEFNNTSKVAVLDQIVPALGKSLGLKTAVENSLLLKGHLDGTVSANGQVNVVATVDSIKLGSMSSPGSDEVTHYTFPIRYAQFILPAGFVTSHASPSVTAPTASPNSMVSAMSTTTTTTTTGTVAPAPAAFAETVASPAASAPLPVPAPEPSTIVFFGVVLGGLILGRRRLSAG